MLLAIDIGNTNVVIGGFCEDELKFVSRIGTDTLKTEDEYACLMKDVLTLYSVTESRVTGCIISSVVPPLTSILKTALYKAFDVEAMIVGPGMKTGLNIRIENPGTVGADLICALVAVAEKYEVPALVFDMGTATKVLALDETATFIGASIMPGVKITLDALTQRTAQLPQISLDAPPSVMGKNTTDSMRSGIIFGTASMIDGMIDRYQEAMDEQLNVVATGGLAGVIVPHCTRSITYDENLVLTGLRLLYQKNFKPL